MGWCHPLLVTCCHLATLVTGVRLPRCIPMSPGMLKLPLNPILKGVTEHLPLLETDWPHSPLSVLLEVEALVGQVEEN